MENDSRQFYALQVKTKGEEKFMRLFRGQHPYIDLPIHFPQRSLDLRKGGKITPTKLAVFPGYVFLELGGDDDILHYAWAFRKTDGFFRFLRSNRDIAPLRSRDLALVLHFIRLGPVAGKSKVLFDEDSRIVVLEGPLSGLEGSIVKVDRRKCRAKVRLDLYGDSFSIDLAFEVIAKARQ